MRVQCRVDVPVYAHGGPRNRTCVLRSRVICEHTNGSRASSPRAIGSFVQDMMLCPQGVGQLAGESTPRTCAQSAPAISSAPRARPRGCRWRTTPSMRSPELDGASSRRSYAQSPLYLPHTHGPPCHLTPAEKRAVAPVNVRGGDTFVTTDSSHGGDPNATIRGHTIACVAHFRRPSPLRCSLTAFLHVTQAPCFDFPAGTVPRSHHRARRRCQCDHVRRRLGSAGPQNPEGSRDHRSHEAQPPNRTLP